MLENFDVMWLGVLLAMAIVIGVCTVLYFVISSPGHD
jgi:hypothetical protein